MLAQSGVSQIFDATSPIQFQKIQAPMMCQLMTQDNCLGIISFDQNAADMHTAINEPKILAFTQTYFRRIVSLHNENQKFFPYFLENNTPPSYAMVDL